MKNIWFNIILVYGIMSQSDYIKLKTINNELNNFNKMDFPPVLNSQLYTSLKSYTLEKTIINTKPTYNSLAIPNVQYIFNIPLTSVDLSNNCANFTMCKNTNDRPNRVLQTNLPKCLHP
jgi:hypothetical protein